MVFNDKIIIVEDSTQRPILIQQVGVELIKKLFLVGFGPWCRQVVQLNGTQVQFRHSYLYCITVGMYEKKKNVFVGGLWVYKEIEFKSKKQKQKTKQNKTE